MPAPSTTWSNVGQPTGAWSGVTAPASLSTSAVTEGGVAWTQIVLDTFTAATGTLLSERAANSGGTWLCDAVWQVQFGGAAYERNTATPSMAYAQISSNKSDDSFAVHASVFRGADDHGVPPYQEIGGITFLQKTGDISDGEGCMVFCQSSSSTQVELRFQRRGVNGTVAQNVLLDTLNVNPNSSAGVLSAEVSGLQVTVSRNSIPYTPVTLTADLRDGSHQRTGLCALTGDPSGRYFMDNFRVDVLSGTTTYSIVTTVASIPAWVARSDATALWSTS